MQEIINKLNINEKYTKVRKVDNGLFNKVKSQIRHEANYNMMADLLFLPTTAKGYRYLLIIVDLYTDLFDCEPLKNKSSDDVLFALKQIFKRGKYTRIPHILQTDSGSEFKGNFHKYLYDNNVLHTQTLPGRHQQQSNIESLNRLIGRLLNGYMNSIEIETEETCSEWINILPIVILELNNHRKKRRGSILLKDNPYIIDDYEIPNDLPKFNVGELVHYKLNRPENALGHLQSTPNFREGDIRYAPLSKKIEKIIVMNDKPRYRYILNGIKNASFMESELFISDDQVEKQKVKKLINSRMRKGKKEFLVWWDGDLKINSTWEPEINLLEDGLKKLIDNY